MATSDLEPKTRADTRGDILSAAYGGGIKTLGTLFRIAGGLGVSILIARTAGAASFGQYFIGVTFAQMLAQIGEFGLQSGSLRFIPIATESRDEPWLRGILRATIWIPTAAGALIAIPTFFSADVLAIRVFDDPDVADMLRLFAFAIPLTALATGLDASLRGYNRVDLATIGVDIGFQLPKLLLVATLLSLGFGVVGAAYAHIGALMVSSIGLYSFLRRQLPSATDAPGAVYRMRALWQQALPVYITRLLRLFNGRLELMMLGVFSVATDVGIYAAALQIGMVGSMLNESLVTVSMPLISGAHHRGGKRAVKGLLQTVTRWCLMATFPYYLTVLVFSRPLLEIFGSEFREGYTALLLLASLPLMNAVAGVAAAVLTMTGNARLNTFNSMTYLALTVGLDLWLIPTMGLDGAAIAVFGATAVVNLSRTFQVRWIFGYWPVDRSFIRPLIASLAAGAVGLGIRTLTGGLDGSILLVLGIGSMGLSYAIILYLLGAAEEDRLVFQSLASRIPLLNRLIRPDD